MLAGFTIGVDVEAKVDAAKELGDGVGVSEVEAAAGSGGFVVRNGGGGGWLITCHLTRSRVAMESSTEEWPTLAPPV